MCSVFPITVSTYLSFEDCAFNLTAIKSYFSFKPEPIAKSINTVAYKLIAHLLFKGNAEQVTLPGCYLSQILCE